MPKNKLDILQEKLRSRRSLLQEDLDDIQSGDEYDPVIHNEIKLEIKFINKTLNSIWEIKHPTEEKA